MSAINPDRPLRGRRLTCREFTALTGRPRPVPANDNVQKMMKDTKKSDEIIEKM